MKKFALTLAAAALSLSSFGAERILYSQNFETVPDVESTGWTYGAAMSIGSDAFGKFLELNNNGGNGRSGVVTWGQEIFLKEDGTSVLGEDGIYTVSFGFSVKAMSNNQFNGSITVFTNHKPVTNQPYRLPWSPAGQWNNYVMDITQANTAADADLLAAVNEPNYVQSTDAKGNEVTIVDPANAVSFTTGQWYYPIATVNTITREVEYVVNDVTGEPVCQGTLKVPETDAEGNPISMFAEGMYAMTARYTMTFLIDDIKVSYESSEAFANKPTVALTRLGQTSDEQLNLNLRAYTITFLDGETLHVAGTDGQNIEVEWADCDGNYVYETTTSGTLKAWTTCEGATSEVVEVEVDCTPCPLPAVTATISSVEAGYGKTYTLSVSNAEVPIRPTIFIDYEFTGENGEKLSEVGVASGAKVTVTQKGVLKLTSSAFGYQSTSVTVDNNIEFETKKVYDFARMTPADIKAAGFPDFTILNSAATSGFNNWTARKRLFYYDAATKTTDPESGEDVYTAVYPFGYIADDNTTEVVEYAVVEDNADGSVYFEGINVFEGHHVAFMHHLGLYNDETAGGNDKIIVVNGLDANDFVVCNKINNYGGNSNHPIVNTREEYYAQLAGEDFVYSASKDGTLDEATSQYSVNLPVYRIDTVCTKISIFSQKNVGVENVTVSEEATNNDPWYYTIDGRRLAEPTSTGIYIHQGKKIFVR